MNQRQAVIVDAVRTPMGKRDGMLRGWHPVDLLAMTLDEVIALLRQRDKSMQPQT